MYRRSEHICTEKLVIFNVTRSHMKKIVVVNRALFSCEFGSNQRLLRRKFLNFDAAQSVEIPIIKIDMCMYIRAGSKKLASFIFELLAVIYV